jgi:hypothetical protein
VKALFANLTTADFRGPSQRERGAAERKRVHALFDVIQVAIHARDRATVDDLMTALASRRRERFMNLAARGVVDVGRDRGRYQDLDLRALGEVNGLPGSKDAVLVNGLDGHRLALSSHSSATWPCGSWNRMDGSKYMMRPRTPRDPPLESRELPTDECGLKEGLQTLRVTPAMEPRIADYGWSGRNLAALREQNQRVN